MDLTQLANLASVASRCWCLPPRVRSPDQPALAAAIRCKGSAGIADDLRRTDDVERSPADHNKTESKTFHTRSPADCAARCSLAGVTSFPSARRTDATILRELASAFWGER